MGMSAEAVGLTLLAVAEVPNFYSGLLPSLWTIGHFSETENAEANYWIRRGEVMASGLTLAVGVATSVLTKSPLPLIGVIIMAGILLYLYEHALRNGSGADISNQ
jgi:hypothetical protein